jgi:hypothetical protein
MRILVTNNLKTANAILFIKLFTNCSMLPLVFTPSRTTKINSELRSGKGFDVIITLLLENRTTYTNYA